MVTGKTIDQAIFAQGCAEAMSRYQELLEVRDRMPSMTLEQNAEYADLVVRTYGRDEEFVTEQLNLINDCPVPAPSEITASTIGCLAFFSLHAPTETLRSNAFETFKRYNTPHTWNRICLIM